MAVDFLPILAGSAWSAPYFNQRADLPIVLIVPGSCNPSELRLQCAASSGAAASGDAFGDVQLQQQPGNIFQSPFTIASVGVLQTRPMFVGPIGPLPTPFFRLFLLSSATITNTFTIMTARWN